MVSWVMIGLKSEKPTQNLNPANPPVEDSKVFYRVVCGSFNNRVYAEEMIENLKSHGYKDIFIDVFNNK